MAGFVDVHAHLVFGVDDGARSLTEAVAMLTEARDTGTRLVFATPHIVPGYKGWTASAARIARIRRSFDLLSEHVPPGIKLRFGFEVTACPHRLRAADDPARFRLAGTELVLVDGPQLGPWLGDTTMERYVGRVRSEGLTPILAHPERRAAWRGEHDLGFAERLKNAGALLQLDASGLTGGDGSAAQIEAHRLLRAGLIDLISSDGHGQRSPVRLDIARDLAATIVGEAAAARLVDGSALGIS